MTRHENGPRKPKARSDKPARKTRVPGGDADVAADGRPQRQRIAKLMARVGLCSRRDAEAWIVDGRVSVNGEVLTSPARDVDPDDAILVDGQPLPEAEKTRLFLFHKPRGLVTSDHDPEGRETVTDYLRETWADGPRVVTIGRLDINTEGLLLLTNDGGLARVLELPATGWVRRYRVRAKGETDQGVLDRLRDGVTIEGVEYAGIEAKLDRTQGANSWLTMGLREGKNREIKRVLEHIGLEVNRLIRLSFGPFQLLDLPEGKVEEVKTRVLRDQLGESLAAEAGVLFPDDPAPPEATILKGREVALARKRAEHEGARGERPRNARRQDDGERRTSGERSGRAPPRQGKDGTRSFDGKRSSARASRDDADRAVDQKRERPVAGTRKHVSALRADEAKQRSHGSRTRIERAETVDRKDRAVKVERIVRARPDSETHVARRGAGRGAAREIGAERPAGRASRDRVSPSAMAKRVRVALSGGGRERREVEAERPKREDRPGFGQSRKVRTVRPSPSDAADSWADRRERPAYGSPDGRPARQADERPRKGAGARASKGSLGSKRPREKTEGGSANGAKHGSAAGANGSRRQVRTPSRAADNRPARAERDGPKPYRGKAGERRSSDTQVRDGAGAKSTRRGDAKPNSSSHKRPPRGPSRNGPSKGPGGSRPKR